MAKLTWTHFAAPDGILPVFCAPARWSRNVWISGRGCAFASTAFFDWRLNRCIVLPTL